MVALLDLLTGLASGCTCTPTGSGPFITILSAGCHTATSSGCTPSYLVPALVASLNEQDKYNNENYWNPCKAAGVCLMLLATCCEDDILPHVLPFGKVNIKHADWRNRDDALTSFGSILEGPDPAQLKTLVEKAMAMLIELMKDTSVVVKDMAAWTIGRVCE